MESQRQIYQIDTKYLASSSSSGTVSDNTALIRSPFLASISTKPSYCASVRGKPSRRNPLAQSPCHKQNILLVLYPPLDSRLCTRTNLKRTCLILSAMIPITMSSLTSPPSSMMAFACCPIVVPAATAPAAYPFRLGHVSAVMFTRNVASTHAYSAIAGS